MQNVFFSKDNYVNCTELHLSKSNESHQFMLCGGGMAVSCLATMHELEDVGMVFPQHFRKLGIPSLNMVVCSFVSFCVDIPHVHGDF